MNASYLGCDPGLNGGFSVVSGNRILYKMAMPILIIRTEDGKTKTEIDRDGALSFLATLPAHTYVAIEKVQAFRKQRIDSTCTTCKNYGVLLMGFTAASMSVTVVPSDVWQSHFSIVSVKKAGGIDTKKQALEVVKRIYPNTDFRKSRRSHIPHDGMVDAALIANYCQFLIEGEENGKRSNIKKDL